MLAHHYAMAVRPEDADLAWAGREREMEELRASALRWSRKAGDLAIGRYEIDDGISLLRRAVELEADPAREAELWFAIGHASALKYDGAGLVEAMERALELGASPGEVYPELAFQWAYRAGMWQRRLDDSLVEGWVQRAVAESAPETPTHVRALVAKSLFGEDLEAARSALALAEHFDDPELRVDALGALEAVLEDRGEFREARQIMAARLELIPEITDPDRVADAYFVSTDLAIGTGRCAEARELVARMEETVAALTPHHRVHGLGGRLNLESAVADWEAVRGYTQRLEEAVEANLATPCPFNVGLHILLATGWTYAGDTAEADRLLARGEELGMAGYARFHSSRQLGLAVARRDTAEIRRLIDSIEPAWLTPNHWQLWSAFFDGLVELDDRERIEAEAPPWLERDMYVTAFAARALAVARGDGALLEQAAARFEAMGLERHAAQTRARL
jgi:tetratricopeptide (TPR) repeat protein